MPFDFLTRVAALSPANLTIRERARLELNPNELRWRSIFPRVEAPSIKLSDLETVDLRFAGGRREWNAPGREIPVVLGPARDFEMVPINPTHHFDERALQHMRERAGGMAELYTRNIIGDVDSWATRLANAADIQIERDAFDAWYNNQITVMDPKTGSTVTVAVGIAAGRYVAAGTTLAAAANAWLDFLAYARDARATMGSIGGVRLRQARLNEILADAPAINGDRLSLAGVNQRMQDEGFGGFQFIVDERTYHGFTDGGSAYTTQYYVPLTRMAFQPAGGRVGNTHFAPVTRAYDYFSQDQVRNVQDFTVFYSEKNSGKTLLEEAQANALSVPEEQNTYVVTGIA
jgi:hypothetical protein